MRFTLLSYNIERGFHSREHVLEEKRLLAAKRVVAEVKPDIVALTEACYGRKNAQGILMDYKALFGFEYGMFGGFNIFGPNKSDEGGNCLLSNFPMQAEAVTLAYKGAVRGRIQLDELEDKVLMIDVVHPSYSVADADKISTLRPLVESRCEPYILTGDFNTVHPDDRYDWDAVRAGLMKFNAEKADSVVKNWQYPELVPWLFGQGLADAFAVSRREATVPTPYGSDHWPAGVRMDFFFHSQGIRVVDAYVLKNKDTEIASDHYPIVGVFEV